MTVVSKNVYIDKLNNILNQSRQNLLMLRQVYWFYVRNNDKDANRGNNVISRESTLCLI